MCGDCQGFFGKYAEATGRPQLVTDPSTTRVFMPDGKVIELNQPSDMPLDPFNNKAAIGAGVGSEGLSSTQR
jgi:hypothetical protein